MANDISYLPVWQRYLQQFREAGLTHEEIGELFVGMMEYHFENKAPAFTGAGKCVWPFIKPDLDQAKAKYAASVVNGAKGGKRKPSTNPAEPNGNPGVTQGIPSTNPAEPMSMTMSKTMTSLSSSEDRESTPAPAKQTRTPRGAFGWVRLTDDEYNRLLNDLGEDEVKRCIAYVDESAQTTGNKNKWRDWNLVVRKCSRQGWGLPQGRQGINANTGPRQMDEDETAAIRRMLEEAP